MVYASTYILFVLSFFIFQYLPKSIGKTEHYYYPRIYILFSLLVFLGCRGFIITDWVNYYKFYTEAPTLLDSSFHSFLNLYGWEHGFVYFSCFLKIFTKNYFVYQFILFFLDLLIIDKVIREYVDSRYYGIAFISFFVFQGFIFECNALRNSKSVMFFLLSVKYIRKQDFIRFFLLNLIGVLFHTSALLYFPMYFILNRRYSKRVWLIIFFVGNFFLLAHVQWILICLQKILPLLGQSRILSLINNYKILTGDATSFSLGVGFIERTFVYLLVVHYSSKMLERNENLLPFINMIYIFMICFLFLSEFTIIATRFSRLFVPAYWVIIPAIYNELKFDKKKIFIVIFLLYCVLKMLSQCRSPAYAYSNVLFSTQDYNHSYSILKKCNPDE